MVKYNDRACEMTTAIVSSKGWIVVPVELRKKYHLQPGARVALVDYGGVLSLVPALMQPVEEAAGLLRGDRSLVQALLEERSRDRAREN
jgi:bifunctional DNA-binding transcriptional regulator/antitoxin component of YhaV-PrlF toxin-antitoxin module